MATIFERLRKLIVDQLGVEEGEVVTTASFVDDLNAQLGIPETLGKLGVSDPDIDALVSSALKDPSTGGNPIEMTPANTRALLETLM